MKSNSIWSTLEMTCVAMGFTYEDYTDLHAKECLKSAILSKTGYSLVNQIFDNSYAEYCARLEATTAPYKLEPLVDE